MKTILEHFNDLYMNAILRSDYEKYEEIKKQEQIAANLFLKCYDAVCVNKPNNDFKIWCEYNGIRFEGYEKTYLIWIYDNARIN